MRRRASLALALVALVTARTSFAGDSDEPPSSVLAAPPRDTAPPPADAPKVADVLRPWLYAPDPSAPPPGHVVATMDVGMASINRGAGRPFAADVAHEGAVLGAGAEVGLAPHVTIFGQGLLSGRGGDAPLSAGAIAGLGLHLGRPSLPDVALTGGYLRELGGSNGVWARATIAGDLGKLRLMASVLGSHVFAPTRDGLDLLASTGLSYRVVDVFRLGAEYVVQDLEGAWETGEPDGGIKHFIGPNAELDLLSHHVRLLGGPAFGLSAGSPRVLGRLAATYVF